MARRGAGATGVAILLLLSSLPFAAGAETFGALSVSAPDWQLVVPPAVSDPPSGATAAMNYTDSLFHGPGDLNGDGFDDLVGWAVGPGHIGQFVGWGQANGAFWEEACPLTCRGTGLQIPEYQEYFTAGARPAVDAAPSHVDVDKDGRDDWLVWYGPNWLCADAAGCPMNYFEVIFRTPLSHNASNLDPSPIAVAVPGSFNGEPPAVAYLTGPLRPGDGGAVLVEKIHAERTNNGTTPAYTQFQVFYLKDRELVGASEPWNTTEPTPTSTSAQPRPPRFIAAPDFGRDGLADLVLWSPPAPSATGGPSSGTATILNGPLVINPRQAQILSLDQPQVSFGDFDGDGHPDIANWGFVPAQPGISTSPFMNVNFHFWTPDGIESGPRESVHLQGPSIFASQPPPRLQAGDIDGNGRADFVTLKYDTTSASAGHILVDVFVNPSICGPLADCAMPDSASLSFSSEIMLSGTDIYTNDAGLRLNVASDYDGDGQGDITVGYFGGNAPERGRTSVSGLVAVLFGRTVLSHYYGVWIDTEPGGVVLPGNRTYTIHIQADYDGVNTDLRINISGLAPDLYLEMNQTGPIVVSSSPDLLAIEPGAWSNRSMSPTGSTWDIGIPVRFNWSAVGAVNLTLDAYFHWALGSPGEHFYNPHAARYDPGVEIEGPLVAESDGRLLAEGGWARAGAPINWSGLSVRYAAAPGIPISAPGQWSWRIYERSALVAVQSWGPMPWGPLSVSVSTLPDTRVGDRYRFELGESLAPYLIGPYNFTVNLDGDLPTFGAHLPLDSEWVTSTPTFTAVDIFDNESGVDPDRIEYSWENDGGPFVQWNRATALPGQSAAEVVGQAMILFPEGNLSNVIWRVWDKVGNGPAVSPIFGVKVDTTGITFRNPRPPASDWQNTQSVVANVEILAGSSGVYRDSVEHRFSTGGLFDFGAWITAPTLSSPLDPTFVATTALILEEGDANWIQWRADSNAQVGVRLSDPFQIRVDSLRPIIDSVQPNDTSIFPLGRVALSLSAHEGSPQGVAQRGLDTTAGAATFRVKGPADLDFGAVQHLSVTGAAPDGWSASFAGSAAFARGNSTVEFTVRENGGRTVTALTTVRVNQPPRVTVESTPANFTVAVLANLTLNATALDPEGQPLRYLWTICVPNYPQGSPLRPPRPAPGPLSNSARVTFSATGSEALRTDIARSVDLCVVVRDSMDGEVRTNVTVQIVAALPPEPTPPTPTTPQVTVPSADASLAAVVLVIAAAVAALALLLRRRRRPPDNV